MSELNLRKRKVALYGRCATGLQGIESTSRQEQELQVYANSHGNDGAVSYMDIGSGLKGDRPALNHLLEDAREGKIDTVLVTDYSRLARSAHLLEFIKRQLEKARVVLIAVNQDAVSAMGLFVSQVMNASREYERATRSARIRQAMRSRKHKK